MDTSLHDGLCKGRNIQGEEPLCSSINLTGLIMDFEKWFAELKSDAWFWQRMNEKHRLKNLATIAHNVHDWLTTMGDSREVREQRTLFDRFAQKHPNDATQAKELQGAEAGNQQTQGPPLTGEARQQKLQEWLDLVNHTPMIKTPPKLSYAELAELGGVRRPKDKPWPMSSPEEIRIRDRHLAYVKHCYEPVTGQPNGDWIEEKEFNLLYDSGLI